MQRVDFSSEPPRKYEYLRAMKGKLAPPLCLADVVEAGVFGVAEEVAQAIVTTSSTTAWTRPDGYTIPAELAKDLLNIPRGKHEHAYARREDFWWVLEVGLWLAKHTPEYWGVDPFKESYCTVCGGPRPLEEFTIHEARCDLHYQEEHHGQDEEAYAP